MNRLLEYYQKELNFLKQHGKAFAHRFPKIARRLGMVEGESEDPHVSRLIESFALLTSRIHQRLDDDIPEVIDALLSTLAPQFLRPRPSACIVMINPDRQRSGLTGKNRLAEQTTLFTHQSEPLACQFQTVYPVMLLPIDLSAATLHFDSDELSWQLRLNFEVWPGATIDDDRVRLYLHGPGDAVNILYTLLCSEIYSLSLHQDNVIIPLLAHAIHPVGFEAGEAMLTRDPRIAPIHILLLDYFWFPHKFSFIDIQLPSGFNASDSEHFELRAVFKRNSLTGRLEKLAPLVDRHFFRLHCTPVVNLFKQRAEPITFSDAQAEYPIVPDARSQGYIDVWAVNDVSVQRKAGNRIDHLPVAPLLIAQPSVDDYSDSGLRWQLLYRATPASRGAVRQPVIAFNQRPQYCPSGEPEIMTINTMCTNGNLAHQMQFGDPTGDFSLDAPVAGLKISALTHPTRQVEPNGQSELHWRFLSLLSLNHQLLDGENGARRLKEILELYNTDDSQETSRLFALIQDLSYRPITARLIRNDPHSLARGLDLTITFTREALQEPEYYLLCCLLDRLIALYAPVNSFTRLTTCIEHEAQTRREWPVRAGKLSWL